MSRIYVVTDNGATVALVEADSQAQAVNAVVSGRYQAKAATASETANLMSEDMPFIRVKTVVPAAQTALPLAGGGPMEPADGVQHPAQPI